MTESQDSHIADVIKNYSGRLMGFISKRVNDEEDAEDILQDVFYQFAESVISLQPIEQITSWLFTVTRNKITDSYRKKRPVLLPEDDEINLGIEELLSDETGTPETEYIRSVIRGELSEALDELPVSQKEVFVMHEIDGLNFKEISGITGEGVNTLISRKHYAVIFLRKRLKNLRDEFLNS